MLCSASGLSLILASLLLGCGSEGMEMSGSGDADGDGLTNDEETTLGSS
ncbi:MAG: hypothetical protein JRF42_06760 [Deltaproteobacteria bacterium]|nr:hypothetical protein [Deltaproteobacteria bacterium]MBW2547645.1 hypothetical protein [Deltaproteobacteria bacterium]